jgi:hypothetical protein
MYLMVLITETLILQLNNIFLVNNQLDAQLFSCMFIAILYMFRAAICSSSGELIVSIRHVVYVTLYRCAGLESHPNLHTKRLSIQSDLYHMSY